MKSLCLLDQALLGQFGVNPAAYGGLLRWWDAAALTYSDATNIDTTNKWTDRSAAADHAQTSGTSPQCRTNIQNGLRAIQFAGSDDLSFTALTSQTTLSVMAVLKLTGTGGPVTRGFLRHNVADGDLRLDIDGATALRFRLEDDGGDSFLSNNFSTAYTSAVCMAAAADSAGSNNCDFYEGATARGTGTIATFSASLNRIAGALGGDFIGYLMEICVWSQKRTAVEITALYNSYFKPKWGLP